MSSFTDARDIVKAFLDQATPEPLTERMSDSEKEAAAKRVIQELQRKMFYRSEPLAGWFCPCGTRLINMVCPSCGKSW